MLPAFHVGRRVRVARADFEALLEGSRTAGPAKATPRQAQQFWEGEMLPTPAGEPAAGEQQAGAE